MRTRGDGLSAIDGYLLSGLGDAQQGYWKNRWRQDRNPAALERLARLEEAKGAFDRSMNGVKSSTSLVEVDCPGGRTRVLQGTYYSQPNLRGSVVGVTDITQWSYPSPGTLGARFFIMACG